MDSAVAFLRTDRTEYKDDNNWMAGAHNNRIKRIASKKVRYSLSFYQKKNLIVGARQQPESSDLNAWEIGDKRDCNQTSAHRIGAKRQTSINQIVLQFSRFFYIIIITWAQNEFARLDDSCCPGNISGFFFLGKKTKF